MNSNRFPVSPRLNTIRDIIGAFEINVNKKGLTPRSCGGYLNHQRKVINRNVKDISTFTDFTDDEHPSKDDFSVQEFIAAVKDNPFKEPLKKLNRKGVQKRLSLKPQLVAIKQDIALSTDIKLPPIRQRLAPPKNKLLGFRCSKDAQEIF